MVAVPLSTVFSIHSNSYCLVACTNQFFTARKRSLGQGNVFTRVCHSVHGNSGGGNSGFLACITGHMTSLQEGSLYPGRGLADPHSHWN